MVRYISVENKKLVINDIVFAYTDKIRIMSNDIEFCILQHYDSRIIEINALKGQVIKLYIYINDDWLYLDKIIYNYETINITNDLVLSFLTKRENLIKGIMQYGIKI